MRNLKRALSLAVASVMLFSMMVVGTSAAGYPDVTSANNQEAIEVLKAVGVMKGDDKGNFNPAGKVTRNEMAVVMSNLLDLKIADYKGTSPFTDVPAWAEPYVSACYANKIVTGTSATTYSGDASVTAAQAALMMMKALGYFQYQSDFGDDWQLATVKQASKIELFKGIEAGASVALTRNDVAQLGLNTLKADMVEASKNGSSIKIGDITITGDVEYKVAAYSDTYKYDGAADKTQQLCEKLYKGDLKLLANGEDAFGRPANEWTYKSNGKTETVGSFGDEADYTLILDDNYSADAPLGVFQDLTDNDDLTRANDIKYFVNGDQTDVNGYKAVATYGTTVELFVNDNNKITAVVAYYYSVDEITDVDTDVTNSDAKDGVSAYVTFDNEGEFNDDDIAGFNPETYVEDTFIAYILNGNDEIIDSFVAKSVEGSLSTVKGSDFVTIGSAKYYAVKAAVNVSGLSVGSDFTYALYLDQNGNIIGTETVEEGATTIDDVYYLDSIWCDDKIVAGSSTTTYYAQVVALDGTISEVKLETKLDGTNAIDGTKFTAGVLDDPSYLIGKLYFMSDKKLGDSKSNNDKMNLIPVLDDSDFDYGIFAAFNAVELKKDTTRVVVSGKTYRLDADTKYVLIGETGEDLEVSVKTGGIALVGGAGDQVDIITADGKNVAKYVIITSASEIEEGSTFSEDAIYVKKASSEKGDGYYNQEVYLADGTKTTFKVDEDEYPALTAGFYTYDTNSDGYYELEEADAMSVTYAAKKAVWDGDKNTGVTSGKFVSMFETMLTIVNSGKTLEDIETEGATFVDLHDTKDSKQYDRAVKTLSALNTLAEKEGYTTNATLIMNVSEDGAVTIIMTNLTHTKTPI